MEFLTGLIIGISIGFVWGIWRATQSFIDRIMHNPEEIKELMDKVDRIHKEHEPEESDNKMHSVRVEFIDDVCYLYDKSDKFLAQGSTVTDAISAAEKRFPGMKFALRLNESKESHQ